MAAAAASAVPSYVPASWRSWVAQAAAGTGLPASVVAAQINEESGFNAGATSPTGAQGAAQIEPGTWAGLGLPGSPYTPSAALAGYIKIMSSNLSQYKGNVRDALAAYNAGSGNIGAGYGYADTILGNAGAGSSATASPPTYSSSSSTSPTSSSSSSGSYDGLGGFLLKAMLTVGLLFGGLFLALYGVNGLFGGRPAHAARSAAGVAAMGLV